MLQDYELFVQLCKKRGIVAPSEVSKAVKASSVTGELRISCFFVITPIFEILAQILASSTSIKILDLRDCMMLPRGVYCILNALCEGSLITSLDLTGNHLCAAEVAEMGQVFVHNSTLKRVQLEWSNVGCSLESFSVFCRGLSQNHSVEELNLRFNQLAFECVEYICKVIRWNKCLKILDLSWNTLGMKGGQSLLEALADNWTILELGIRGNCVADDVTEKISGLLHRNQCRSAEAKVVEARTSRNSEPTETRLDVSRVEVKINEEAQIIEDSQEESSISLIKGKGGKETTSQDPRYAAEAIDPERDLGSSQEAPIESKDPRDSSSDKDAKSAQMLARIRELDRILQERATSIESLTKEITARVSEVDSTKIEVNSLHGEIERLKREKEELELGKTSELAELQKAQKEAEATLRRRYRNLQLVHKKCLANKKESDLKIKRYEKDMRKSAMEIRGLKDKLLSNTQAYEDLLSRGKIELHRIRRELKERDNKSRIEMDILKETLSETTDALQKCREQLRRSKGDVSLLSEKQKELKARLVETEDMASRYGKLNESFQELKADKESLDSRLTKAQGLASTLQRQVIELQNELVEPQKRYDTLKEELNKERNESHALKIELIDDRNRLKEQNLHIDKLNRQIAALNAQLNDIQREHAAAIHERDKEIKELKDAVANKERYVCEIRFDEAQRVSQLYAALNKYMNSMPPTSIA
ncbi:hypothetical protein KM043_011815 [Ampulex compressa]|nr:hypothetical protein KM043_011815 [Ampulex compressa]